MDYNIKIVVPICRPFHNMNDFSFFDGKQFTIKNESAEGTFTIHYYEEYDNSFLKVFFSLQDFVKHSFWFQKNIKYHYLEFNFL
mgnify:CR=1 FL=1